MRRAAQPPFQALLLAVAAVSLTACANVEPVGPGPAATASAPRPVAGYDWFFHTDEGEARLAYGLAESDDVPFVLACREGSGRLELSATAPTAGEIHVESGGETERFVARAEPSELHEGVFLTAQADADAPVFQRFRRLGWLALWQGGERRALASQPGSESGVARFFEQCG